MDSLKRVRTDTSVCANWLFVLVGSCIQSHVHIQCRDSRKETTLPLELLCAL